MKASTINEIKNELKNLSASKLLELTLRLAKYKKENKELITYLLFEAHDEQAYITNIKSDMDEQFAEMNKSNLYLAKKSIRKILRTTNKFIRYSGSGETAVQLLIYFCSKIKDSRIPIHKSTALNNIYERQIIKINKGISSMHEDLQYDYKKELEKLS